MTDLRKKQIGREARHRRAHLRIRQTIQGSEARPRLAVHKSTKYVYAQLIDDAVGQTLVAASSQEPGVRAKISGSGASREAAKVVGATVAERALEKGIKSVVFDRGGFVYHGKIKDLADAAREKGLEF